MTAPWNCPGTLGNQDLPAETSQMIAAAMVTDEEEAVASEGN